ncbi:MAG: HEAT repeat domain-containing protein, partial [Planctomycetes bacterium]|nr:HEAT repeat domain-containing protein [Planctomycetota bacterium]
MNFVSVCQASGLALLLTIVISPAAASEPASSPEQILETFSSRWKESDWTSPSPSRKRGYMRPPDDEAWQVRMRSIQDLVSHGRKSIPALLKALKSQNDALRILAAQTLGYLAADVPQEPLLEAARSDKNASV